MVKQVKIMIPERVEQNYNIKVATIDFAADHCRSCASKSFVGGGFGGVWCASSNINAAIKTAMFALCDR